GWYCSQCQHLLSTGGMPIYDKCPHCAASFRVSSTVPELPAPKPRATERPPAASESTAGGMSLQARDELPATACPSPAAPEPPNGDQVLWGIVALVFGGALLFSGVALGAAWLW